MLGKQVSKKFFSRRNVVVVGAKRTPIGSFMGQLANLPTPQLGTVAAKAALAQSGVPATDIEEVYMGCVLQAGSRQAPARQVTLGAGCNIETPATDINKVCASGMKSVIMATQAIAIGDRNVMLAGGMESMSNVPHLQFLRKPTAYGHAQVYDGIIYDGLQDAYNNTLMGACSEKFISEMGITREAQDEWAIKSYEGARKA